MQWLPWHWGQVSFSPLSAQIIIELHFRHFCRLSTRGTYAASFSSNWHFTVRRLMHPQPGQLNSSFCFSKLKSRIPDPEKTSFVYPQSLQENLMTLPILLLLSLDRCSSSVVIKHVVFYYIIITDIIPGAWLLFFLWSAPFGRQEQKNDKGNNDYINYEDASFLTYKFGWSHDIRTCV